MHPNRSLRKTVRFLTVGGDAHIAPLGTIPERSEKTYMPVPPASGPMKGIGPYGKTVRFLTVGAMPTSPRWVRYQNGQKRRTRLSRRLPGRCGHRPLRKNGSFPHRRGRCLHRPAGYGDRVVRKDVHARTADFRADVGIGPYEKTVRFPTVGTLRSHRKRREHPWI